MSTCQAKQLPPLKGPSIWLILSRDTMSCGEAGKYYINPSIPEKETYCTRLGKHLPHVLWLKAEDDQYYSLPDQVQPDDVAVRDLLSTNPNEYFGKKMICNVTLMRLHPPYWWFMSCLKCHKTSYVLDDKFKCSDPRCPCPRAKPRYKVRLIGSDGIGEVEFVFFSKVAEQIIQRKADVLARSAAKNPDIVPTEISPLISQKFTLNVIVSQRGLEFGDHAFQVNSVDAIHKKATPFDFSSLASGSSQSANVPAKDLPAIKSSHDPTGHETDSPKLPGASSPTTRPPEKSPTKNMGDLSNTACCLLLRVTKQPIATGSSIDGTEPKSDRKRSSSTGSSVGEAEPKPNRKRATATKGKPSTAKELFKRT